MSSTTMCSSDHPLLSFIRAQVVLRCVGFSVSLGTLSVIPKTIFPANLLNRTKVQALGSKEDEPSTITVLGQEVAVVKVLEI